MHTHADNVIGHRFASHLKLISFGIIIFSLPRSELYVAARSQVPRLPLCCGDIKMQAAAALIGWTIAARQLIENGNGMNAAGGVMKAAGERTKARQWRDQVSGQIAPREVLRPAKIIRS
jgi:hypothetical protein